MSSHSNVLLCGFYIFGCTVFVLQLLTGLLCTSRVQSHGKASAESSITFHLVNLLLFVICSISQVPCQKVHGA